MISSYFVMMMINNDGHSNHYLTLLTHGSHHPYPLIPAKRYLSHFLFIIMTTTPTYHNNNHYYYYYYYYYYY